MKPGNLSELLERVSNLRESYTADQGKGYEVLKNANPKALEEEIEELTRRLQEGDLHVKDNLALAMSVLSGSEKSEFDASIAELVTSGEPAYVEIHKKEMSDILALLDTSLERISKGFERGSSGNVNPFLETGRTLVGNTLSFRPTEPYCALYWEKVELLRKAIKVKSHYLDMGETHTFVQGLADIEHEFHRVKKEFESSIPEDNKTQFGYIADCFDSTQSDFKMVADHLHHTNYKRYLSETQPS